ncbi:unnamed protein product [Macrosiphum euphorbiae]|uniref:Uncharacterized protein n=1 Tax=Macrosiphum euphorbiae TaxID=13131 RepID=A0AAV0YAH3_9HEMI|nr:unnamed protein product [Macrosiphum euphorbiae]
MIGMKLERDEILSTSPLFFVLSTLWVCEHNQVCDKLSWKSKLWTDEKLYTTARKIVTGQMMTIMMNEILNVELRPEVYHHRMENICGSNTPVELYILTMAICLYQVIKENIAEVLQVISNHDFQNYYNYRS